MEVSLAHDYAMMDRQFCDADLAKWVAGTVLIITVYSK
jgi:hypothetical protein